MTPWPGIQMTLGKYSGFGWKSPKSPSIYGIYFVNLFERLALLLMIKNVAVANWHGGPSVV